MRKGLWSPDEDDRLRRCIAQYTNGSSWSDIARKAGLERCGKSCRRRWMNHLRPNLKQGKFTPMEIRVVLELHQELGNRWSKIAAHLQGRTDNDVKNLWHTQIKRQLLKVHKPADGGDWHKLVLLAAATRCSSVRKETAQSHSTLSGGRTKLGLPATAAAAPAPAPAPAPPPPPPLQKRVFTCPFDSVITVDQRKAMQTNWAGSSASTNGECIATSSVISAGASGITSIFTDPHHNQDRNLAFPDQSQRFIFAPDHEDWALPQLQNNDSTSTHSIYAAHIEEKGLQGNGDCWWSSLEAPDLGAAPFLTDCWTALEMFGMEL